MLSLALVAGPVLMAQEATGALTGTVRDRKGNPVEGVEVRITAPTLQGARTIFTDSKGIYRAPLLPPGSAYSISLRKEGYVGASATGIERQRLPDLASRSFNGMRRALQPLSKCLTIKRALIRPIRHRKLPSLQKLLTSSPVPLVVWQMPP